jgi:hypothetical protein
MNIDIIPNNLKKFLNHGFLLHPEEVVGQVIHNMKQTLKRHTIESPAREEGGLPTATATQGYTEMQESHFNATLQYLTFAILLRLLRRNATLDYNLLIPFLALLFLIIKILLTYRKYKKLPNIPLLYELRSFVLK